MKHCLLTLGVVVAASLLVEVAVMLAVTEFFDTDWIGE